MLPHLQLPAPGRRLVAALADLWERAASGPEDGGCSCCCCRGRRDDGDGAVVSTLAQKDCCQACAGETPPTRRKLRPELHAPPCSKLQGSRCLVLAGVSSLTLTPRKPGPRCHRQKIQQESLGWDRRNIGTTKINPCNTTPEDAGQNLYKPKPEAFLQVNRHRQRPLQGASVPPAAAVEK